MCVIMVSFVYTSAFTKRAARGDDNIEKQKKGKVDLKSTN